MEKKFVIVTGDTYPDENSGAVRIQSFAKIFTELGFSLCVIGMGRSTSFQWSEYDGISYCSLRYDRKKPCFAHIGKSAVRAQFEKSLEPQQTIGH